MARQVVIGHILVSEPETDAAEECPRCGFDALLSFPCSLLTEYGVSTLGPAEVCSRCWDEGHREG